MPAISYVYIGLVMLIMTISSSSSSSSNPPPPPPPPPDCSGSIISFVASCVGYLELLRLADPLQHHQMPQSTAAFSRSTDNADEQQMWSDTKKMKKPYDEETMQAMCCASIREQLMVPSAAISDGAPSAYGHGEGSGSNLTCTCGAIDAACATYPNLRGLIPSACGLDAGFIQARCPNLSPATPPPPISSTGTPSEAPSPLSLPSLPPSPSPSPSRSAGAPSPSPLSYSRVSSSNQSPPPTTYPGSGAEGPDSKKNPQVPPSVDESGMLAVNQTDVAHVPAPSMSAAGPVLAPPTDYSGSSASPSSLLPLICTIVITALALHGNVYFHYISSWGV